MRTILPFKQRSSAAKLSLAGAASTFIASLDTSFKTFPMGSRQSFGRWYFFAITAPAFSSAALSSIPQAAFKNWELLINNNADFQKAGDQSPAASLVGFMRTSNKITRSD